MPKRQPRKPKLLFRGSSKEYDELLGLMAALQVNDENLKLPPEEVLTDDPVELVNDYFRDCGIKAKPLKAAFEDFINRVVDPASPHRIDMVGLLIIAHGIVAFSKLELNKALPPNARLCLPLLYAVAEELARRYADDMELTFDKWALKPRLRQLKPR